MTAVVHVLLATYNGARYLPRQWASLEQQEGVELIVHAAYWKYVAWRRLTGAKRGSFPLAGSNFIERPVVETRRALHADLDLLDEIHRTLRDAAAAVPAAELDRGSAQRGVTKRALLTGVAAHDLYHAGQIQLLKRLERTCRAEARQREGGLKRLERACRAEARQREGG